MFTTRFNIKIFYFLSKEWIYVILMILTKYSDYLCTTL